MQTRLGSFVETLTNTLIGLVIAFVAQGFLLTVYGVEFTMQQNAWVTFWMTLVSILRSYCLRRVFNLAFFRRLFGG